MPKIKITLNDGETELEAIADLKKALDHHDLGLIHKSESFDDIGMVHVLQVMEDSHSKMLSSLLNEINNILNNGYNQ